MAMRSVCFLMLLFISCATGMDRKGLHHTVRRGETIWTIASSYRVDPQVIAEYNNIEDPKEIDTGKLLYIPPRKPRPQFKLLPGEKKFSAVKGRETKQSRKKPGEEPQIEVQHDRLTWPIDGAILSPFGYRGGRRHDGVDIKAAHGTPIKVADEGEVVFSGRMRGYGNLILVRHDGDLFTAYAHNSKNKSKKGEKVKRGQVIGLVGRTGRATGPHLHFEVRQRHSARNPLFFLPKRLVSPSADVAKKE
ncbi:MAG: LysM peptidoglycan-binding domain-containing M23 family metallopeptidase [Deltaproteobacteria bacterium]|nr:LysM peptidoglycan-binding domain-containing M23 family metallopeptidase [Deltaproteobacteria bacterium]